MALVDSRIGREEIKILFAFNVPDKWTLSTIEHHRQRMVIMGSIAVFAVNVLLSFRCFVCLNVFHNDYCLLSLFNGFNVLPDQIYKHFQGQKNI